MTDFSKYFSIIEKYSILDYYGALIAKKEMLHHPIAVQAKR